MSVWFISQTQNIFCVNQIFESNLFTQMQAIDNDRPKLILKALKVVAFINSLMEKLKRMPLLLFPRLLVDSRPTFSKFIVPSIWLLQLV